MRKKIITLIVSAGLLAAPAVFAATTTPAATTAVPAQAADEQTYFNMPMMNNGQGAYAGRGGFMQNRNNGYGGYGMMQSRYGYEGRGAFGISILARVITTLLVWTLLIMLICALGMHLRRMRKGREWWMKNKMEGKPEGKEEVKA